MTAIANNKTFPRRLGRDYGDWGRFGVVIPSNNLVLEPEFYATVRSGATGHFSRIPTSSMAPEAYDAMIEHLDEAVSQLARAGVDAILYACLSTSLVQPAGWDAKFVASVRETTGLPAVTAAQSVVASIRASVRRQPSQSSRPTRLTSLPSSRNTCPGRGSGSCIRRLSMLQTSTRWATSTPHDCSNSQLRPHLPTPARWLSSRRICERWT